MIENVLNKNFIIFDIGSSFAKENSILKRFSSEITYIEIDAVSLSDIKNADLYKNIKINKGIHSTSGTKEFIERQYIETSSFLEIRPGMVEMFNMDYHFKTKRKFNIECTTVNDILRDNNITQIDFLKTDVEGLDYEILKSISKDVFQKINVIKSEIRFQPFYESEAPFYEVCKYVSDLGFEFINFSVLDEWKLNTKNQRNHRDGRMVWGDFVFFKVLDPNDANFISDLTKQILIAKSLKFNSYAEYMLESNKTKLSSELYEELNALVANISLKDKVLNSLFYLISYTKFIYPIRKFLKYLYNRSRVNQFFPQGV